MAHLLASNASTIVLPMRLAFSFFTALTISLCTAEAAQEGESKFLGETRQLTFEGKRSGEAYFHPDGNLLTFQSEREPENPFYQIYLLDLLSGETARVSPGTGKTTCSFFQPGSSRLLYASTHLDPEAAAKQKAELEFRASGKQKRYSWDYDEQYEIFAANQDGTQVQRLTESPGYDAEGAYSPDGKQIVFCSLRSAYPATALSEPDRNRFAKDPAYFGEIYTMQADGSGVKRLTDAPGYDGGPFFSPDGQRIIWRHFDESGMVAEVWTMKSDGSDKRRVTDFKCMSWAPFYHPSGKYIVFTSNKLGFENFELFIVDAEGAKEPVRVTFTNGFDGLPVFSPDGKRLLWTSNRTSDKASQLYLAKWNEEAAREALEAAPARGGGASSTAAPVPAPAAGERKSAASEGAGISAEITKEDIEREVRWLADPQREGRGTGSEGAQASAEWLASYFRGLGLKPVGQATDFFQPFEFNAGERMLPDANKLMLTLEEGEGTPTARKATRTMAADVDFRPLSFTENATVEGEVVFAGYGLSVPEAQGSFRYNSYDGLDVKDKVVLILRYVPEQVDAKRRAYLNRYAGVRYKAMMARERGAKAVLFVSGPNSARPGELLPLAGDNTFANSGIVAASLTGAVADALLAASGKSLKELQTALDDENPHAPGGFLLKGTHVQITAGVEHIKKTDRNVLALLPAADGAGDSGEYVLVGAHYDHLGKGRSSSSMARSGEEGEIHPGADDNGSGTAIVMEMAAALAQERAAHPERFRRGVIFALWSGEEIGIIGSSKFCEQPPVELKKIAAYINFDMVGRLQENKLTLQAIGSSKSWRKLIEKRNVAAGFSLSLQDDPYLPTDVTSFYPKQIPVLNFFTGAHEDYHRPTDTAEKLNYEGAERIGRFAKALVADVVSAAERPDFSRVRKSTSEGGTRETLRAYLGTIPDYTTEVKGVKLSGVRGGSPAEKAGMAGGDILVEFAGQKITNIYDYTYALDAVKIGQKVKVVVERAGKRVDLEVTPEARK
jgi:Tol biopolymer transport system component